MRKKTPLDGEGPPREVSNSLIKRKKRDTSPARESEDPAWKTVIERIGGREGLLKAAASSQNPKATILAELLLDPAFKSTGTKKLAQKAGLSMPEVVDLYRDLQWLKTTMILHERLPEIVEGATEDAKPQLRPCEECKGSGLAESGDKCWICRGSGEIRRPGDKDKLRFVGEAAGMVGKPGPAVQNNIQVVNQAPQLGNSFDDLVRKATITVNRPKLVEVKSEST